MSYINALIASMNQPHIYGGDSRTFPSVLPMPVNEVASSAEAAVASTKRAVTKKAVAGNRITKTKPNDKVQTKEPNAKAEEALKALAAQTKTIARLNGRAPTPEPSTKAEKEHVKTTNTKDANEAAKTATLKEAEPIVTYRIQPSHPSIRPFIEKLAPEIETPYGTTLVKTNDSVSNARYREVAYASELAFCAGAFERRSQIAMEKKAAKDAIEEEKARKRRQKALDERLAREKEEREDYLASRSWWMPSCGVNPDDEDY